MYVLFRNFIPSQYLLFVSPIVLFLVGFYVEKRYMSRVSIFANSAALFTLYYPINMPIWLGSIINLIIVLGLIGGFAYVLRIPLIQPYYMLAWIASSIITGILMLLAFAMVGNLPSEAVEFVINLKNTTGII